MPAARATRGTASRLSEGPSPPRLTRGGGRAWLVVVVAGWLAAGWPGRFAEVGDWSVASRPVKPRHKTALAWLGCLFGLGRRGEEEVGPLSADGDRTGLSCPA